MKDVRMREDVAAAFAAGQIAGPGMSTKLKQALAVAFASGLCAGCVIGLAGVALAS